MLLFESSWTKNWVTFERLFDTTTKKIIVREIRNNNPEYFIETDANNPRAHYTSVLDKHRKFEKHSRGRKGANLEFGYQSSLWVNIRENYWNIDSSKNNYNPTPLYWCLDIETRSGVVKSGFPKPEETLEEITMFQIYDKGLDALILLGTKEFKYYDKYLEKFNKKYTGKDAAKSFKFIQCKNEIDLIDKYLQLFKMRDPLVIYAWYGDGFDFPYMYNRFKKLGYGKHIMSNHGNVTYKESEYQGQIVFSIKSPSNMYIDLMKVYQKFTFSPQSTFSLDNIAEVELGENKIDHSEYVRFDDFYTGNYTIPDHPTDEQKESDIYKAAVDGRFDDVKELSYSLFCYYGAIDTYLLERLIRKFLFHDLMISISSKMGVLLSDAMGTVKPWSQFLSNVCYSQGLIMPPKEDHDHPNIVGGYVRDPITGKYKWIISIDVTSQYPLLGMVAFNMSPETYLSKRDIPLSLRDLIMKYYTDQNEEERLNIPKDIQDVISQKLREENVSLAINGALFDCKSVGIIPELVLDIFGQRKKDKGTQFEYERKKILIGKILENRLKTV